MATLQADVMSGPRKLAKNAPFALRKPRDNDLEAEAYREWLAANDQLLMFYKSNKDQLDDIDYGKVAACLSSAVASCFLGTSWKVFASALGIPDALLEGVEQRAKWVKVEPLQLALQEVYPSLKACSRNCSLGHLVEVLKESGRWDVLNKILPQVQGLLKEAACRTARLKQRNHCQKLEALTCAPSSEESSLCSSLDSGVCLSDGGSVISGSVTRDSIITAQDAGKQAALPLLPGTRSNGFVPMTFFSHPRIVSSSPGFADQNNADQPFANGRHHLDAESTSASLLDRILPKAEPDKLTVLVSHLEEDTELARELAGILETEHGCYVLIQAEILPGIHTDPALIEDLIEKVNAIVPLVSRAYLNHYEHARRTSDLSSADSTLTYEVYSLFLHRLVASSFRYHMLFPVRTPDVEYRDVRRHHIFSKSKVLCKSDIDQLVKTMHACEKYRSPDERRGS